MVDDPYFEKAYLELKDMFEGKEPYSLKRAEFLVEWAYSGGKKDYQKFCCDIDSVVNILNDFIDAKGIRKYRTAPNYAIFDYFTVPSERNSFTPITYDFEDVMGQKDYNKMLVSKLMETHSGQCTSMPLFYKIVCDELGGQSAIALAPLHSYIKHIGEDGKWVNVELTHGSFVRDVWIIETMDVSTEAIRNGVYLTALNDQENIAFIFTMLSMAYQVKYHSWDYFIKRNFDLVLGFMPKFANTLVVKYCWLQERCNRFIEKYGEAPTPYLIDTSRECVEVMNVLDNLGFSQMSFEEYDRNVRIALERLKEKGLIQ